MAPPRPGLHARVCTALQLRHCTVMLVALCCGQEGREASVWRLAEGRQWDHGGSVCTCVQPDVNFAFLSD